MCCSTADSSSLKFKRFGRAARRRLIGPSWCRVRYAPSKRSTSKRLGKSWLSVLRRRMVRCRREPAVAAGYECVTIALLCRGPTAGRSRFGTVGDRLLHNDVLHTDASSRSTTEPLRGVHLLGRLGAHGAQGGSRDKKKAGRATIGKAKHSSACSNCSQSFEQDDDILWGPMLNKPFAICILASTKVTLAMVVFRICSKICRTVASELVYDDCR